MKIGIINYINTEQEAEIGDKIKVEGREGEILEIINPDDIKIKLDNGKIVTWDKDYVNLLEMRK